ncbi:MAG: ribonuclease Z [Microscillaceae bacterium]|nr:ribonuclease Z [Microscillaceae bacterium]
MYELTILGISAATPAYARHPTAQVLTLPHTKFLIDCGEGTQMQMQRYKIKPNKIKTILITHLHGDHYLGLTGLLSTMHLQKRQQELNIFAPRELAEVIRLHLQLAKTRLNYKISFFPLPETGGEIFYEDDQIQVETILMTHRIHCMGFLFKEKNKKRKVLMDKLPEGTTWKSIAALKEGKDVKDENGELLYKLEDYTLPPRRYSFAHCSDTKFTREIIPQIQEVDLLYHESTFLHEDLDKAEETFHSTAFQAATIAKEAQVKKLVIGHFSSRYKDLKPILEEARTVFENTFLGVEGETITIE